MFRPTRHLISSFLILSILVFPAAFLRRIISVVVNICLPLLVTGQVSLWLSLGGHGDFIVPNYRWKLVKV